jgi:hypothetical protein
MLMKKTTIFFCLLGVFVLSITAVTPVTARKTSWGYSTMPFTDDTDDIYAYSEVQHAYDGIQGDYCDEIDIQLVTLSATGITLVFNFPIKT